VEESQADERQGGDAASDSGVGGMFDVQMILEMRRRVLECEDDSGDDDDSEWDD